MEEELEEWNGVMSSQMKLMWDSYANPKSKTFGNARESAINAGYTPQYASTITNQHWYKAKKRRMNLLPKAELALEAALDMDLTDSDGKVKADLARVQTDVAKFVAKTQGKNEGYSERTELTGKDGQDIVFMPVELLDKYNLNNKEVENATSEGNIEESDIN